MLQMFDTAKSTADAEMVASAGPSVNKNPARIPSRRNPGRGDRMLKHAKNVTFLDLPFKARRVALSSGHAQDAYIRDFTGHRWWRQLRAIAGCV
jgi:hypothetical protein